MTRRASIALFLSKPWVFKFMCLIVAVPIVFGAFSPLITVARGVYS
ncbi:MAG: hypothetical protein ABL889_22405 [Terricaulis sp.]